VTVRQRPQTQGPVLAALAEVRGLAHSYGVGEHATLALRDVDLELSAGEHVAVMGRSGSGKTTLLNVLAGLEVPVSGRVLVAGYDLSRLRPKDREDYRRRICGYVWQQPEAGLLPGLTVLQNVLVPLLGEGQSQPQRLDSAIQLLDAMRLGDKLQHGLSQLTPVETQRLAIAVALGNRPQLLLADELTARLEWAAARELLGDLEALLGRLGTAAVLVTHDPRVGRYVDRAVLIRDGIATSAPEELLASGWGRWQ
jgi:ABC-type lipoprotein export system ATPase subunit